MAHSAASLGTPIEKAVSPYQFFVDRIYQLLDSVASPSVVWGEVDEVLDGRAAAELRRLVPLTARRQTGAFFTNKEMSSRALSEVVSTSTPDAIFLDPACGAGDLLLHIASQLELGDDAAETVTRWSSRLWGIDLQRPFVRAARARLTLMAVRRSSLAGLALDRIPDRAFSKVRQGDGTLSNMVAKCDQVVLNPPFGYVDAPAGTEWATGRVSEAALFSAQIALKLREGAALTAILPDVLRSGSRYKSWRRHIESLLHVTHIQPLGVFDRWTDVDVFVLRARKDAGRVIPPPWWSGTGAARRIADEFDVHVGPVVPHRDPNLGTWHPYIWPKRLPLNGEFNPAGSYRRYGGRTFEPPFVVIRRTSRPGQPERGNGVIIRGNRPVAVENHLLVLQPKKGDLASCQRLLVALQTPTAQTWLDERIRCRHVTVSAIRDLPLTGDWG